MENPINGLNYTLNLTIAKPGVHDYTRALRFLISYFHGGLDYLVLRFFALTCNYI